MTIQQLSQSNRLTNTMAYICYFFFVFILKWYTYIAVRLNRHSFSDQKTNQGLNLTTLRWRRWAGTSPPACTSAHPGDPLTLNCSWRCDLLLFSFEFCCMVSSEHRRRKVGSVRGWWGVIGGWGQGLGEARQCVGSRGLGSVLHAWGPSIHIFNYYGYKNVNHFS